jgi:hypothetical protein
MPEPGGQKGTSSSLKSGTVSNAGSSIKLKNVTVAQLVQRMATFSSCDGNPQWVDCSPLLHAVAREVSNDVCLDCFCHRDVGAAAGCVALLELGKSTPSSELANFGSNRNPNYNRRWLSPIDPS